MTKTDKKRNLLQIAADVQAIAQVGLTYCRDPYDKERYEQLLVIAAELLSPLCSENQELSVKFFRDIGYSCPKIDVRAFIHRENQILLVKETQDGYWSLPGGWADVNYSAAESVRKEVLEETGLRCTVTRLLALWDTAKHDHPPHWPYIYKCIFACDVDDGPFIKSHETSEIAYFPIDTLPDLSIFRITKQQIKALWQLVQENSLYTIFD